MNIMRTLKLGKHYAIERFGIMVGGLAIALVVFVTGGVVHTTQAAAAKNATTAVYTSSFQTSATDVSGDVLGVFANEERTRAAVVMKLSEMSDLPIDATEYQMTLSGVDDFGYATGVQSNPACGMYVYGDSGYMVFYMTASESLPRQRLGLYVNLGLSMTGEGADAAKTKDTFSISFNPGADGVAVTKALDGDTFDPIKFYQSTITAAEERELRKELVDDIGTMRNELSYISEFTSRVKNDGIETEGITPEWIIGDAVEFKDEDTMRYKPATTLSGGLMFDWVKCSIADGESYIDAAMAASDASDVDELLNQLGRVEVPTLPDVEWRFSDGTTLSSALAGDSENDRYQNADEDTTALEGAWTAYGATKAAYQGEDLRALLELEYEGNKVAETFTSTTTNDGTIFINR